MSFVQDLIKLNVVKKILSFNDLLTETAERDLKCQTWNSKVDNSINEL